MRKIQAVIDNSENEAQCLDAKKVKKDLMEEAKQRVMLRQAKACVKLDDSDDLGETSTAVESTGTRAIRSKRIRLR